MPQFVHHEGTAILECLARQVDVAAAMTGEAPTPLGQEQRIVEGLAVIVGKGAESERELEDDRRELFGAFGIEKAAQASERLGLRGITTERVVDEARSIRVATTVHEDVRRVTTQLCGRELGDGRHAAGPRMWGGA